MVLEEVWVFVEIDGFEGELAKALATVGVGGGCGGDTTAAELGASAVLVIHRGGCAEESDPNGVRQMCERRETG